VKDNYIVIKNVRLLNDNMP